MQMLGRRTPPAVAFDESCCHRTDCHFANVLSKFVNAPPTSVVSHAVVFLQISRLLRLPISTAGYLLR
jgi:hypothetical protein